MHAGLVLIFKHPAETIQEIQMAPLLFRPMWRTSFKTQKSFSAASNHLLQ